MAHPLVEFEGQIRARIDSMTNEARMRDAPLDQVHAELTAFAQSMLPHVEGSARHFGDEAWGARMRQMLHELPVNETRAYAQRMGVAVSPGGVLAPAAPTAPVKKSSVFANAKATAKDQPWKANAETYDQSYTFKCVHCGAPQQVELDFMCRFCHKKINQ